MKRYEWFASDSISVATPKICSIGFSEDPIVTRHGPSIRDHYIIHYVLSGKGFFNGKAVGKGEGFLITPGMAEEYHADEKDPWSFLWIISQDACMEYFFSRHQANEKSKIFRFQNLCAIQETAELLKSTSQKDASSLRLCEMFLHIFNASIDCGSTKRTTPKVYLDFSVNYITANLHLPILVEEICKIIGVSQPYLYKIFKQETGLSPKQYISACKLKRAQTLLLDSQLSISQIATAIGFQDVFDFSKFFAKQTHLSPTAYRNTYR